MADHMSDELGVASFTLAVQKHQAFGMEVVKSMVFRFIEIHYNRKRNYTTNDGYPPLMKRREYYRDQLSAVV